MKRAPLLAWVGLAWIMTAATGCKDDCQPKAYTLCEAGTSYWVDSCNARGEIKEECEFVCNADGTDCAPCSCGSNQVCVPHTDRCECPGFFCQDNCCLTDQVCYTGMCCTPRCEDAECGLDFCGGLCGSCSEVETCGDDRLCHCRFEECAGDCCQEEQICRSGICVNPIAITAAEAPDETTIRVTFTGDAGERAETLAAYNVTSAAGDLQLTGAVYDAEKRIATLTTRKQKLGISYNLTWDSGDPAVGSLRAEFLAAETAKIWITDWTNFGQNEITVERVAVGENCVIYVEQFRDWPDPEHSITEFDERIYPVLTDLLIAAPDMDGNDRILLLGLDGGDFYGGYFSPVNAYKDQDTMAWWQMHSNEMEIIHINVATTYFYPEFVVPHEFQHLLYQEKHGFQAPYYEYHNEGLAECAVHAVYGPSMLDVYVYQQDPNNKIRWGLSLVNWGYAEYEYYVQAYLFWTYIASRLDGIETFREIFDLLSGSPAEVNSWLISRLGDDFPTVLRDNLLANWIGAQSGDYGFGNLLQFEPHRAPRVPAGTLSVDLEPFAGAFFSLAENSVDYPATQGPNIVYAGINGSDFVDLSAPFDVAAGVLLVFNRSMDYDTFPPEHSGPDIAAVDKTAAIVRGGSPFSPAWLDPPPVHPDNRAKLERWRSATLRRIEALRR